MTKAGFTPISFDAYVDLHMKSNPKDMTREEVVSLLRSALTAHENCTKCHCGNRIMVSDINFENNSVTTRNRKTRKSMGSRPVPVPIMAELKKYFSGLDVKQEKLFNDYFSRYMWTKIRQKLGLEDFTFHDLRKTFGSVLAQRGVSTAVIQKLLEHSSPDLTNKVYTNVDPVLRHAVDQIPAGDWL